MPKMEADFLKPIYTEPASVNLKICDTLLKALG